MEEFTMSELMELKIVLINRIRESKMTKDEKMTLAKYLKEANEIQTKHLLLYGTMVERVSPLKEQQIRTMYESKQVQEILIQEKEKYREFESGIKKFIKYGIVAIAGMPFGVILPLAIHWLYRKATDTCVKKCGGLSEATPKCKAVCYMNVSKAMVAKLQQQLGQLGKIENEKKRARLEKKIKKEMAKWQERVKTYEDRVRSNATTYVVNEPQK
jgi:hypothetical protein